MNEKRSKVKLFRNGQDKYSFRKVHAIAQSASISTSQSGSMKRRNLQECAGGTDVAEHLAMRPRRFAPAGNVGQQNSRADRVFDRAAGLGDGLARRFPGSGASGRRRRRGRPWRRTASIGAVPATTISGPNADRAAEADFRFRRASLRRCFVLDIRSLKSGRPICSARSAAGPRRADVETLKTLAGERLPRGDDARIDAVPADLAGKPAPFDLRAAVHHHLDARRARAARRPRRRRRRAASRSLEAGGRAAALRRRCRPHIRRLRKISTMSIGPGASASAP